MPGLKQRIEKEITDCCKDRFSQKMKNLDPEWACTTCEAIERVLTEFNRIIAVIKKDWEILFAKHLYCSDLTESELAHIIQFKDKVLKALGAKT